MIFFSAPLTIQARRRRPSENGRKWLRSAWNFGKTRFSRFPTFHFSTPKNFFWQNFLMKIFFKKIFVGKSTNCLFLRSYGFLDVIGRCASKSYPQSFGFQLSTTFGGGVKEIVSIFFPTFGQKWLQPISLFGWKCYVLEVLSTGRYHYFLRRCFVRLFVFSAMGPTMFEAYYLRGLQSSLL